MDGRMNDRRRIKCPSSEWIMKSDNFFLPGTPLVCLLACPSPNEQINAASRRARRGGRGKKKKSKRCHMTNAAVRVRIIDSPSRRAA